MTLKETTPPEPSRHPFLSVVIPVYNGAKTLGEQLAALKAQAYAGDLEIIVVDNGSSDTTVKLIRDFQSLMPQLRLVHATEKQGKSYARNVGVEAARGEALLFCDIDDVAAPGWVAAMAKALEKHDLVAGTTEVQSLNQNPPPHLYSPEGATHAYLNFLPVAMGCNAAVSREAFDAVGGFSEEFPGNEDVDLSWRLQLRGYGIHSAPDAIMYYRYRSTLGAVWKQIVAVAEAEVNIYRHYAAHGMPRSSRQEVWRRYKWLIKKAPGLWWAQPYTREKWVRWAARSWGRLKGSLRYRTLYL